MTAYVAVSLGQFLVVTGSRVIAAILSRFESGSTQVIVLHLTLDFYAPCLKKTLGIFSFGLQTFLI
jgi:hypothetical protein